MKVLFLHTKKNKIKINKSIIVQSLRNDLKTESYYPRLLHDQPKANLHSMWMCVGMGGTIDNGVQHNQYSHFGITSMKQISKI